MALDCGEPVYERFFLRRHLHRETFFMMDVPQCEVIRRWGVPRVLDIMKDALVTRTRLDLIVRSLGGDHLENLGRGTTST